MQCIRNWRTPTSVTQLKAFLGYCQFYAGFHPKYSYWLAPLSDLMRAGVAWKWTPEHAQAFQSLKRLFECNVQLWHLDENLPYYVHCDTSNRAVGYVLSQHCPHSGKLCPVDARGKKLSPAEENYPSHEKESFAVVHALKTWSHLLRGVQVFLFSDFMAIQWIQT